MSFTGLLNRSMHVRFGTVTPGTYAEQTIPSFTTVYTSVPCRFATLTHREAEYLLRAGIDATHRCMCDPELVIVVGYELVIDGEEHEVTDALDRRAAGPAIHHNTIMTRRVS